VTPYYEQSGVTIYHGDNRAVMAEWEGLRTQAFDLLLTDPPYGLGQGRTRCGHGAKVRRSGFDSGRTLSEVTNYGPDEDWDDQLAEEAVGRARALCRHQIIFGGNYYDLPPARCWLVWDKENGDTDFADCELAWTNLDRAVRRLTYRWNGMLQQPGRAKEPRIHPAQKPEALIVWALGLAPASVQTVLDPFMGIGTTLVAAKRLGKQAVGIEQSERWCEEAVRRLQQEALPLAMEEPGDSVAVDPVDRIVSGGSTRA
jgi:site-specific DNA-methyltransferase (adenine-specific)